MPYYTQTQARLLDALKSQHILYMEAVREVRGVKRGNHVGPGAMDQYRRFAGKRQNATYAVKTLIAVLIEHEHLTGYQVTQALSESNPNSKRYLLTQSKDFWSGLDKIPSAQNLFLTEPGWFDLKNRPYEDRWKALNDVAYHRRQQVVRLKQEGKNRERLTADSPVVQAVLHAHSLGLRVNEITEYYEGGTRATIRKMVEKYGEV